MWWDEEYSRFIDTALKWLFGLAIVGALAILGIVSWGVVLIVGAALS